MSTGPISLAELELLEAERWSEREFTSKVRTEALDRGWLFYHTKDSRGSDKGFPDCVMVRGGRLIFAELKVPGGRFEREQKLWRERLWALTRQPDGERFPEVYEWWPKDWLAIKELLG